MYRLRRLVFTNRLVASTVLALALAMRIAMPAGFMPTLSNGHIVVGLCAGSEPTAMVMATHRVDHGTPDSGDRHGKADQPCAFSGLSVPSLAATDPILLVAAILFVLRSSMRPLAVPASLAPPFLRPPLRGPPAR